MVLLVIETNDEAILACLKKRPIVADVPVGAEDSTLGGVTEAYPNDTAID